MGEDLGCETDLVSIVVRLDRKERSCVGSIVFDMRFELFCSVVDK